MITIYTLPTCTYCSKVIEELNKLKIAYRNVNADAPDNSDEVCTLEDLLHTAMYPILKIRAKDHLTYIISTNGSRESFEDRGYTVVYYESISHLLYLIQKTIT